jgi:hypothetical protein
MKCCFCGGELSVSDACVFHDRLCCADCFRAGRSRFCAVCGEAVVGAASARFETMSFHREHFRCSVCGAALAPNTAVVAEGVLRCRQCAVDAAEVCKTCGVPVRGEVFEACGGKWHVTCVRCRFCRKALAEKEFVNVEMEPACVECYRRGKAEGKIDKRGRVRA